MMTHKLSDQKKRMFYSELRVLLNAGLSFTSSFSLIVEGAAGREKELYSSLFDGVVAGGSLWSSMKTKSEFSALDYGVVRIGEESGKLATALTFLADYYERKENQRRTIAGALSYPLITLAVAAIVLVFMMTVVIPMFEQVYSRMGGELPSLTRFMVRLSSSAPTFLVVFSVCIIAFALFRRIYGSKDSYRSAEARLILGIPIAGRLVRQAQLSRFCRIMQLLTESEVPLLQSLALTSEILSIHPYRKSIEAVSGKVRDGMLMADAFAEYSNLYDRKFLTMMRVGEETNSLPVMLGTLSDDISEELDFSIKQMNNMLEPALIILIGAVVAFVLISMYLPMFRLGMTM